MTAILQYVVSMTMSMCIQLKKDITSLPNYKPTIKVESEVIEWNEFKFDNYKIW